MSDKKHIMELDFSKEIKASMITECDACGATLGESYPTKRGTMTASLKVGKDKYGYDEYKQHHFCGEACMRAHLNDRHEQGLDEDSLEDKDKKKDKDVTDGGGEATASYFIEARDIPYKTRKEMKNTDFLDEKRRSFPIKTCEDVKAAVHAWGRYKGSMSFEEFKAKLSRKAHALGCSLPDSWTEKSK